MITVVDIMNNDENENQVVEIHRMESDDVMANVLYTGMLHDVPADLRGLEVRDTGWSLIKQKAIITVI